MRPTRTLWQWCRWFFLRLIILVALVVLGVLLFLNFFEPFYIPSGSMQPTLLPGDLVWVDKTIKPENLKRGDVIVFHDAQGDAYHIKRIVGMPQDVVAVQNVAVQLNGVPVPETQFTVNRRANPDACDAVLNEVLPQDLKSVLPPIPYAQGYKNSFYFVASLGEKKHWVAKGIKALPDHDGFWTVPQNSFFVMGDNRTNSKDSREEGFVAFHDVLGQAKSIWFSTTIKAYACGAQPLGWLNLFLRRSRAGQRL